MHAIVTSYIAYTSGSVCPISSITLSSILTKLGNNNYLRDIRSGAFTLLNPQTGTIKSGINFLVSKAGNKGSVGLAVR